MSCAAPSANTSSAMTPISLSVPPEPALEPPILIWYRGPLYLLESSRTGLYAAAQGVPLAA